MRENDFRIYLEEDKSISSKDKAVKTRISKANAVEKFLGNNLDEVVATDDTMYNSLLKINEGMKNSNGAYSNALRKYYTFINASEFPQLSAYKTNKK